MINLSEEQEVGLMGEALAEARAGMVAGEAPIGCVIALWNGGDVRVVAKGFNRVNGLQRKNAHAEIVAFENGGLRADGSVGLPLEAEGVILVSTLEPCVMCLGACMEVGVERVVYGLRAPADSGTGRVKAPSSPETKSPVIVGGVMAVESRRLFEAFLAKGCSEAQGAFVRQLLAMTE